MPNESPTPPAWTQKGDAELLRTRVCDLQLKIAGSELEGRIEQLGVELEARDISFRPHCYLGDEWFSPEDVPAIAIPFYLAHPRLVSLEKKMMLEVEGGELSWFQRLLRHECGHAIEHAYELHKRRKRQQLFGPRSVEYDPDTYRPRPYSRSYVRNLPNWYAQAHPDEDFAETFAVWLDPTVDWRKQYTGWKAVAKLNYVDELMKDIGRKPAKVTGGALEFEASRIRTRLETFYRRRRKQYATDAPDFYDRDLRGMFADASTPETRTLSAARFLRAHKKELIDSVSRWTGERKAAVEILVKRLTDRAHELDLVLGRDERQTSIEVTAYLATLVTNYRFTGKFKRSV